MNDSSLGFNEKVWSNFKRNLKNEVGDIAYNNWLKQLSFLSQNNDTISLSVPTKFLRDWIVNHYADKIKTHCQEFNNKVEVLGSSLSCLIEDKYSNEKLLKSIWRLKKIVITDTNSIRDNNFNIRRKIK